MDIERNSLYAPRYLPLDTPCYVSGKFDVTRWDLIQFLGLPLKLNQLLLVRSEWTNEWTENTQYIGGVTRFQYLATQENYIWTNPRMKSHCKSYREVIAGGKS